MSDPPAPRPAAVLLLRYPDPQSGVTTMVLTRRTETLPTHRGQIALPGGSRDPGDPDLAFTALREAQEEIGVDPAEVQVIGELPPVYTVVSNYLVTPVVGRAARRPLFRPNPTEVAELIEVPLHALCDPTIHRTEERAGAQGVHTIHYYQYGPYNIWGVTGHILNSFLSSPLLDL